MVSKLSYPIASPSEVVGKLVQGLVSHIEFPYLWLQRDPDGIAALCSDVNDEQSGYDKFHVGECVTGRWDGEWCRGQVVKEIDSEIIVNFVDWGNTESLARADVRKCVEGDMKKEVGALKCRIVDDDNESLDKKLQENDFIVKLKCVAVYDDVFLLSKNVDMSDLPKSEDISCEFSEFSQERKCAYFLPLSLKDSLDNLNTQLDSLSSSLLPLLPSNMFNGQMCGARFSEDCAIYRAKILSVKEGIAKVVYIDHGNSEWRNTFDLFQLPDEYLASCPYVVFLDIECCREQVLSESGVVVKLVEVQGALVARISGEDNDREKCEEVEVIKQTVHLQEEKLPTGEKVLVSVGYVESVDKVWVTPLNRAAGIVKQIESKLAYYQRNPLLLRPIQNMQKDDVGLTTFSEDSKLYRFKLEEGNTVRFIDYGNLEEKATRDFYEMPEDLAEFPASSVCVAISHKVAIENTENNLNVIVDKLNQDINLQILVEDGSATFYYGEKILVFFEHEKHEFCSMKGNIIEIGIDEDDDNLDDDDATSESPSKNVGFGFGIGDEVNFWSKENKRWSKGIVTSVEEGMVIVQGNLGDIHKVENRNLKSPGIPFEALNQVEVELAETIFESDGKRNQVDMEIEVSELKPTFVFPSPRVSKNEGEYHTNPVKDGNKVSLATFKSNETNFDKLNETITFDAICSSNGVSDHGVNIDEKIAIGTIPEKKHLPAMFNSTKDMRQIMDDWITGCLKMLEVKEEKNIKKEINFKAEEDENRNVINEVFDKTVETDKGCNTETIEAFVEELNALVKVEISVTEASKDQILTNLLARVDVNNKDDRDKVTSKILNYSNEDKMVLPCLIQNETNVCTLLKILPFLTPRTASAFARGLQGIVVEVCADPNGCIFIQKFFRQYINTERVDLLLEEILDNLDILAYNDVGTWVVQDIIKHDDRPSSSYLMRVAYWLVKNIESVLMQEASASLARIVVQMVMSRIISGQATTFSQLLENLVRTLLETTIDKDGEHLPLLLVAAKHPHGHNVVLELAANKACLVENKDRMVDMLNKYKSKLETETFGCLVVKGMQGWL